MRYRRRFRYRRRRGYRRRRIFRLRRRRFSRRRSYRRIAAKIPNYSPSACHRAANANIAQAYTSLLVVRCLQSINSNTNWQYGNRQSNLTRTYITGVKIIYNIINLCYQPIIYNIAICIPRFGTNASNYLSDMFFTDPRSNDREGLPWNDVFFVAGSGYETWKSICPISKNHYHVLCHKKLLCQSGIQTSYGNRDENRAGGLRGGLSSRIGKIWCPVKKLCYLSTFSPGYSVEPIIFQWWTGVDGYASNWSSGVTMVGTYEVYYKNR